MLPDSSGPFPPPPRAWTCFLRLSSSSPASQFCCWDPSQDPEELWVPAQIPNTTFPQPVGLAPLPLSLPPDSGHRPAARSPAAAIFPGWWPKVCPLGGAFPDHPTGLPFLSCIPLPQSLAHAWPCLTSPIWRPCELFALAGSSCPGGSEPQEWGAGDSPRTTG